MLGRRRLPEHVASGDVTDGGPGLFEGIEMKIKRKSKAKRKRRCKTQASLENKLKVDLEAGNWGKSRLSKCIEGAQKNVLLSYVNFNPYFELLEDVTDIFEKAQSLLSCADDKESMISSFLTRDLGSFIASIRLGASGQGIESYTQFRLCLEYALYAFFMHKDPDRVQIWSNRQESEAAGKLCRNTFQAGKMIKELMNEYKRFYWMYCKTK